MLAYDFNLLKYSTNWPFGLTDLVYRQEAVMSSMLSRFVWSSVSISRPQEFNFLDNFCYPESALSHCATCRIGIMVLQDTF